jgi:hypothetical protein
MWKVSRKNAESFAEKCGKFRGKDAVSFAEKCGKFRGKDAVGAKGFVEWRLITYIY